QPQPERYQGGGGGRAENGREQQGQGEPNSGIGDGHQEEDEGADRLLGTGRHPDQQQAEPDHQQPQRQQADGEREQPGEELPEQQRVAVDRLRQDAGKRAPVVFAVDGIEAQPDREHRYQDGQEEQEVDRNALAFRGKQPQEQERVLRGHILD